MTITLVTLLKRRPGMSREDFRDYYENHHRLIGEDVIVPYALRYVRRYLSPLDWEDRDCDFDVVMEIDFADEEAMSQFFNAISDPNIAQRISTDEAKLFDTDRIRSFRLDREETSQL